MSSPKFQALINKGLSVRGEGSIGWRGGVVGFGRPCWEIRSGTFSLCGTRELLKSSYLTNPYQHTVKGVEAIGERTRRKE
eukprot:862521-Pyramimonas_sp.AAC.1